ncbi:hypothetical protein [Streptococcus sp. CSL10205-OR2]|uniref:hypothetical protein n=1 Tax=Streptococcus sp. CSL10205-OR2 TaxID=2980558 RepID=UPI0021DA55C1|nr:hypothetical protein [Streptococcus sp. CSL10205-OR2]MCU9534318.1 hypothetical protein [Streptococcus sp. CSL10205-OR2]
MIIIIITWLKSFSSDSKYVDPRQNQINAIKIQEKEMEQKVHERYPQIKSLEIIYDTLTIDAIPNHPFFGFGTDYYQLEVRSKFNHMENSDIILSFDLENQTDLPNISNFGFLYPNFLFKDEEGHEYWTRYDEETLKLISGEELAKRTLSQ